MHEAGTEMATVKLALSWKKGAMKLSEPCFDRFVRQQSY